MKTGKQPKPKTCRDCPLYGDGTGFVPDDIRDDAKVFILMQNPGRSEEVGERVTGYIQGKPVTERCSPSPAIGATGYLQDTSFLPLADLTRERVSVGNVLRCRWKGTNDVPPVGVLHEAQRHCEQYLQIPDAAEVIVAQGRVAWEFLNGGSGFSITNWRGFISPNLAYGRPVYGVLHIADLMRDPKMKYVSRQDWRKVQRVLDRTWPQEIPDVLVIENDDHLPWFEKFIEMIPEMTTPLAIDTEYHAKSKDLYMIGIGYTDEEYELTHGIQISWSSKWLSSRAKLLIRDQLRLLVLTRSVVFHNALADLPVLEQALGLTWDSYLRIDDTMLMHAVLWSELPHSLEFLASLYSQHDKMKHLKGHDMLRYNWGDVLVTLDAYIAMTQELDHDPQSRKVYEHQSLKLLPVLWEGLNRGIRVNEHGVVPASEYMQAGMTESQRIAESYVGWPLNLSSNQQMQKQLYEIERLPQKKSKKTSKVTVDKDALTELRTLYVEVDPAEVLSVEVIQDRLKKGAHPLLEAKALWTASEQLYTSYVKPLECEDGRIVKRVYPDIHIHAQASGRHSTTNPPLAQVPEKLAKTLFIPDPDEVWFCFDWVQQELIMNAILSDDTPTLEAIQKGWDVHTMVCCELFDLEKPPDLQDPHHALVNRAWRETVQWEGKADPRRHYTKAFEYSLDYGKDPKNMDKIPNARKLGITSRVAEKMARRYLSAHPNKARSREKIRRDAINYGMVRTFAGRRRMLLSDGNAKVREAFNHPMQGGGADILNLTILAVKDRFPYSRYIYGVHDSAKFAFPLKYAGRDWEPFQEIVEREWDIYGRKIRFPAEFEQRRPE